MTQTDTPTNATPADEILAGADPGYRWKHLIMSVLMIAGGLWFAYDGWIRWPADDVRIKQVQLDEQKAKDAHDNAKVEDLARELSQLKWHTELDLLFQKVLAFTLPAFGILWGVWTLRETRGSFHLVGNTLKGPGHPEITYENIRRIDKRRWDRKGVAFIHYEFGNPPQPGVMKLDNFAYDRKMTDAILERIEQNVIPTSPGIPGFPAN